MIKKWQKSSRNVQIFDHVVYERPPSELTEWSDHIQIVMVLDKLNENDGNGFNLRQKLRNFAKAIVNKAQKYPIRFIFISDHRSVFQIQKTFA